MNNQSEKDDVVGTPEAGVRDPKEKQSQLEEHFDDRLTPLQVLNHSSKIVLG